MSYIVTDECNGCGACFKLCPVEAISGEKKKLHTIDSEICIDCGVCGKICPLNSITDNFGQTTTSIKKKLWQKPVFDLKKCSSCVICLDVCPTSSITLSPPKGKDPEPYPELSDPKSCIGCNFCEMECPLEAIGMKVQ